MEQMRHGAPMDSTEKGSLGTRSCAFCCLQLLQTGQLSLYSTLWYRTNNIKLVRLYTLFRLYPSVSVFAVLEWFQYRGRVTIHSAIPISKALSDIYIYIYLSSEQDVSKWYYFFYLTFTSTLYKQRRKFVPWWPT